MSQNTPNPTPRYAPAAIRGTEDAQFQEPLDRATKQQFCDLVRDLSGKGRLRTI